jgi:phospholipid/cholesterol/gamma-HCH transport system permease protein
MIAAALRLSVRRQTWRRTTRRALAEQIVEAGVRATGVVTVLAVIVGPLVDVQARLWLAEFGQPEMIGPFLAVALGGELTPLLINLVLIARSGASITAELATMRLAGEVRVLDAQGLDPFAYLVTPRLLALLLSAIPLAMLFLLVAYPAGWVATAILTDAPGTLFQHFTEVTRHVPPRAPLAFVAKCLLPALVTAAICCREGFTVNRVADVPRATTRAVVSSLVATFLLSAVLSTLNYL